jgi:hypothetical protein
VKVLDHGSQRARLFDVAIVAAARLPEAITDALALDHAQTGQPVRRVPAQVRDGLAAHRRLQCPQERSDGLWVHGWVDEQVGVFGHQNISPNLDAELHPRLGQRVAKPLARSRAGQELIASIA